MYIRAAFYAGSFDPPTNGHLDIIARAAKMVDKLIIGVGINPLKLSLFTAQERLEMLNDVCSAIKNCSIHVVTFDDLLVKTAKRHNCSFIVRGLRDGTDFDYEMQMSGMNTIMEPDILTVFLPASSATRSITSTLVRQIASMNGSIESFVPEIVFKKMLLKFSMLNT